jgi:MFS family permease
MNIFQTRNIYYGWFVLAACFFATLISGGVRSSFGVFVIPMEQEFNWSRDTISFALAVGVFCNAITTPFVGWIYDSRPEGGKTVITLSLLILGAATILLSLTSNIVFLIIVYGFLISVAGTGVSFVTIHALIARWFNRKRGFALSISSAGVSVGAVLFAPFASYLILLSGWRFSWVILGAFILFLAFPLALIILRNNPKDVGQQHHQELQNIDGAGLPVQSDKKLDANPKTFISNLSDSSWIDVLKSLPIWQLSIAYFVCGTTTTMMAVHYVPFAIDRGMNPGNAALAFGFMMGINGLGVIAIGFFSDHMQRKNLLALTYSVRGLAYGSLLIFDDILGIWIFAFIAGLSWVASASLTSSIAADIYGLKKMGTIVGIMTFSHQIGGAIAIYLTGFMFEKMGGYELPFSIAGSLLILAALCSVTVNERKLSARYQSLSTEMS